MRVIAAAGFKSNSPKRVGKEMKKKIQRKLIQKASVPMSSSSSICKEQKHSLFMAWDFSLL